MDFASLVEMLRNPGDDGLPDTIYDDLHGAYNDAVSAGDARVSELQGSIQEREAEISRLKSANYDLLMASRADTGGDGGGDGGDGDGGASDDEVDASEKLRTDDLFE